MEQYKRSMSALEIMKNMSDEFETMTNEFEEVQSIKKPLQEGLLKLDNWDKIFNDTSDKIEEKYTSRLNEINSQLETIVQEIPNNKDTLKDISNVGDDLYYKGEKISPTAYESQTIKIVNLFDNVEFNNQSNWSPILANITSATNGEISFTATGKFGAIRKTGLTFNTSHKYYFGLKIQSVSNLVGFQIYKSSDNNYQINKKVTGSGSYELLNTVLTPLSGIDSFKVIDENTSEWGGIKFKEVMIVDLTDLYGAGKEPITAKDFEDYLINLGITNCYFNGTFTKEIQVEYPKTNTLFPIYVDKVGDVINVISKYNSTKDIRYLMTKKGNNNIFDFKEIYLIDNNSYSVSNQLIGTLFFTNGTDFFAPYKVKAINNIDGDTPAVDHFTGGNHGYTGGADGTPTGRTASLKLSVDGREITDYKGYCNFIDIVWVNCIQAMNTKKANGSGREVLKETYELHFDGYKWSVKNTIEILEDVNLTNYYGLQLSCLPSWSEGVYYNSSANRKWNATNVMTKSNSKTCDCISVKKGSDRLDVFIDRVNGIGNGALLQYIDYNAFMESYGKAYFFLIYGTTNLIKGDILTFEGGYRFYSL